MLLAHFMTDSKLLLNEIEGDAIKSAQAHQYAFGNKFTIFALLSWNLVKITNTWSGNTSLIWFDHYCIYIGMIVAKLT